MRMARLPPCVRGGSSSLTRLEAAATAAGALAPMGKAPLQSGRVGACAELAWEVSGATVPWA